MKNLILSLLVSGCVAVPSAEITDRYGVIVNQNGEYGSCVYLGSGYFMTATHVVKEDSLLRFGVIFHGEIDSLAKVVRVIEDISVLKSSLSYAVGNVEFARADIGERVYWIQMAKSTSGAEFFLFSSNICKIDEGEIYLQLPIQAGASGSGLFTRDGKLVGICHVIIFYRNGVIVGQAQEVKKTFLEVNGRYLLMGGANEDTTRTY